MLKVRDKNINMFCKNCGKEIKEGNQFCNNCGGNVASGQSEENSQSNKEVRITFNKSVYGKVFLGAVLLLIIYVIFAKNPFAFLSNEKRIDQGVITSSVVNIWCQSSVDENAVSGGSGTIITTDGIVITNSHVIPQNKTNILTSKEGCLVILPNKNSGQPEEIYWAKPIVIPELSDSYDLAYLQIKSAFVDKDGETRGVFPRTFPSIFAEEQRYDEICRFQNLKLGDPVRIFGYPQTSGGLDLTITDGVISSLPGDGTILTSAKIDAGNSGGLAVDKEGCMVGIPAAISEGKYQNLGVIITTDSILEFSDKLSKINQ